MAVMTTMTIHADTHGNPISGSAEAVDRFDTTLSHLLAYHNETVDSLTSLVTDEPDFAMGQILAAYLGLTSTDTNELAAARSAVNHLDTLTLNEREAAHRTVLTTWLAGDWHGAASRLDDLLIRWPADLLGLVAGHLLDFFIGDAANLRDRVGRSLPTFDAAHPDIGFVHGMYAFGLEESGHYQLAEQHGLAALDRNPDDVWATHAVTHVYEMQGRVDDGIRFLRATQPDWGDGNLFTVHNWWHFALLLLEAGRSDEALAVYDLQVHHDSSAGVPIEMLDASALLWRLHLDGVDVGDRFSVLADAWTSRATDVPWYVFNDLHAVIALAGAGRLVDAGAIVDRLDHYVMTAPTSSNVRMTAEVGLPTCRAMIAFAEGYHDDVVADLLPVRRIAARFGGSHAQRDVLARTLVVAAIRGNQLDLARALVDERLGVRETSVWSWHRRGEVAGAAGDVDAAATAVQQAAMHETRFAAATR